MTCKYLTALILVLNFLQTEGIFFLNEDKVYWNRLENALGMISEDECVWFNGQEVEECNKFTRNYLEVKRNLWETFYSTGL